MFKTILAFAVVCLLIISFNSSAVASYAWLEDEYSFYYWITSWDPEVNYTWSQTGTYWSASVQTASSGNNWNVTWKFKHTYNPHTGDTNASEFSKSNSFAKTNYGVVLSDSGTYSHPGIGHYENWSFSFNRDTTPANTKIKFSATHVVPEPISSTLFVTGGVLLAGRRLLRRKA